MADVKITILLPPRKEFHKHHHWVLKQLDKSCWRTRFPTKQSSHTYFLIANSKTIPTQ